MKKRRKKAAPKIYTPKLTPARYGKYLTALIEGQEAARDRRVFWDIGPGERLHHVLTDFRYVVRKEKLDIIVEIDKGSSGKSLVFIYPDPGIKTTSVQVRGKDGHLKS